MAKKKPKGAWTWAPDRRIKPKVPDRLKAEVQAKADELIERVLKTRYVKPPPKKPNLLFLRVFLLAVAVTGLFSGFAQEAAGQIVLMGKRKSQPPARRPSESILRLLSGIS